jgi:hypothetical protein
MEEVVNDDSLVFRFWWPLLLGLSSHVADVRVQVRSKALSTLTNVLKTYGAQFSSQTWDVIFKGVLFPMVDSAKTDDAEQVASDNPAADVQTGTPMGRDERSWIATMCYDVLTVCVLMCHLPFSFVDNFYFWQFLRAMRAGFEKLLGGKHIRDKMAGPLLDEVHEEALQIAEEALTSQPGLITLGIDGHKDGRGRSLQTITKSKLGVSTFAGCEYMLTERATGERLAKIAKSFILKKPYQYGAIVADNTGNNTAMFNELDKLGTLSHLFFLGCVVHVMDLLVEDIATIDVFATLEKDAHFVISCVKSHSIIYEEFLDAKAKLGIKSDLHLYPSTRFAYLYLMLQSLHKTIAAVRVLIDSPIYKMAKEEKRKRGGEEGRKALVSSRRLS